MVLEMGPDWVMVRKRLPLLGLSRYWSREMGPYFIEGHVKATFIRSYVGQCDLCTVAERSCEGALTKP